MDKKYLFPCRNLRRKVGPVFWLFTPHLVLFSQIFVSNRFWRTAGAFSKDGHLFQTSSWYVPCVLCASSTSAPYLRHTQIYHLGCDFVGQVLVCEGLQKTVFIHCKLFFVVTYSTPILFFYLLTFPPKIVDFVTQIAKFIYKVTIIFLNSQIDYQNPQVEILASGQTCFCICGLFSADTHRHSPTSTKCCRIQTHVKPVSSCHKTISATHLINTAYSIVVNLLTVHPASKPFYRQRWLDNKDNHATISPSQSLWLC
jgi:hypothetical protein